MKFNRLRAIAVKEVLQIVGDPRSLLEDVGLAVLWPDLAAMGAIVGVLLLMRFRKTLE